MQRLRENAGGRSVFREQQHRQVMEVGRLGLVALAGVTFEQAAFEPERRALAIFAFHTDFAPHQRRQLFADRQTQAGAAVFAGRRGVHLREALEQAVHPLGLNSDARIAN